MKKLLLIIITLLSLIPKMAFGAQVTVPSSPSLGSVLYGLANGNYTPLIPGANGTCLTLSSGIPAWLTCASGGGSSGGTWATTTSQVAGRLINYSLNTTDIVTVGGSATTSAPIYLDPNTSRAVFPYASSTSLTTTGNTYLSTSNTASTPIIIGGTTQSYTDPKVIIVRTVDGSYGNSSHGYVDQTTNNGGYSYAAYDNQVTVGGTADMATKHFAGFQSNGGYTGTGVLGDWFSNTVATSLNGGDVTRWYGMKINSTTGSSNVGEKYGLWIGTQIGATTTNNYQLFTFGSASKSMITGQLLIGGTVGATPNAKLTITSTTTAGRSLSLLNSAGTEIGAFFEDSTSDGQFLMYNSSGVAQNTIRTDATASTFGASGGVTVTNKTTTGSFQITGITGSTQCLTADTSGNVTGTGTACGSGTGGASADWNKQTNYGALALTPTTTIPVWIKGALYASSTATIAATGSGLRALSIMSSAGKEIGAFFQDATDDGQFLMYDSAGVNRTTIRTDSGSSYITGGGNFGIGTAAPAYRLDVLGAMHSTGLADALNFVATSSTVASSFPLASTSQLSATSYVKIGNSIPLQPDAFGTKGIEFQVDGDVNDALGADFINVNTGTFALTAIALGNNLTTLNVPGSLSKYTANIVYAGGNWDGVPLGFGSLRANDMAIYNTDGNLSLAAPTTSPSHNVGNIDLYTGFAGSFSSGMPDFRFSDLGYFGIATNTPYAPLSVVGFGGVVAENFTSTSTKSRSTFPYASTTVISSTGNAYFATSAGEVMIATTTPTAGVALDYFGGYIRSDRSAAANDTRTISFRILSGRDATLGNVLFDIGTNPSAVAANRYAYISVGDNAAFRTLALNPDGGFVGIGTTSPTSALQVNTNSTANLPGFRISNNSTGPTYNGLIIENNNPSAPAAARNWVASANSVVYGDFNIKTSNAQFGSPVSAGTSRFYIDPAGNVGLGGTTTPYAILSVKGAGSTTGVNFQTTNSSNSPLFTILDSGFIGAGTTTPTRALSVANTGFAQIEVANFGNSAQSAGIDFKNNQSATMRIGVFNNGFAGGATQINNGFIMAPTSQSLLFGTGNFTEWGRWLTSTGGFLIGTTTATNPLAVSANNAEMAVLDRTGSGNGVEVRLKNTDGSVWYGMNPSEGFAISNQLDLTVNPWMTITTAGNVGIGTTTPFAKLSVNPVAGDTTAFSIGSSTATLFNVRSTGQQVYGGINNTIAAGAGAGTGPTVSVTGDSNGGLISITTGTTPSGVGSTIATITYPASCPNDSAVVYSPADPDAAALSGSGSVYLDGTAAGFTLISGTTGLVGSTNYLWNYAVHCW